MSLVQLDTDAPAPQASLTGIDADAVRRELAARIVGEVRFDTITRALYSTDASVYQIQPLGVMIARNRQDIIAALEICHRFRCPLTMRGGGTSQGGQSIGHGVHIDISKYYNRILEVNAEQRWVRVEPGIVLDEQKNQIRGKEEKISKVESGAEIWIVPTNEELIVARQTETVLTAN